MSATQTDVEESLTCQCGCGLTVHACNHLQCPSRGPLQKEIAEQLALGKTRPEVLSYFAGKYGEKILAAPTTTGFNLVAWIMPFAVVLIAAMMIVVFTRRWRRPAPAAGPLPPSDVDPELRARLDAGLRDYDA
jgi:cytochrome c-type biogenesis protein CcmH/NrfF